ncbi:MAG: hypothetical protein JWM86_1173, partial [Thermoleophilia bacterium]|nr:hypothetical protein [Thermoleophilia bacterium]
MTGPSRPTPPSALDGYRRLARTRGAATAEPVGLLGDGAAARRARRPRIGARAVGTARLVAFTAVLVLIVATSVGLASADTEREAAPTRRAASTDAPAASTSTHRASSTLRTVETSTAAP